MMFWASVSYSHDSSAPRCVSTSARRGTKPSMNNPSRSQPRPAVPTRTRVPVSSRRQARLRIAKRGLKPPEPRRECSPARTQCWAGAGTIGPVHTPSAGEAEPRLPLRTQLVYAAGSVGTGAFYAFNNFVLPPVLKSFGAPDLLIGLLSSTRSIEGALIQPTIGAWSDRVWTRFGRRKPFVLVGVPLAA